MQYSFSALLTRSEHKDGFTAAFLMFFCSPSGYNVGFPACVLWVPAVLYSSCKIWSVGLCIQAREWKQNFIIAFSVCLPGSKELMAHWCGPHSWRSVKMGYVTAKTFGKINYQSPTYVKLGYNYCIVNAYKVLCWLFSVSCLLTVGIKITMLTQTAAQFHCQLNLFGRISRQSFQPTVRKFVVCNTWKMMKCVLFCSNCFNWP